MSVFTAVGVTTATGSETTSKIAVGTAGQIFTSNGTSSLPEFKGNLSVTNGTTYFDGTTLATTAVGTANQVLTSNGASAPTYQNGAAWRLISSSTFTKQTSVTFTDCGFSSLMVVLDAISTSTASKFPIVEISSDNGSSWLNTNYASAVNSFGTTTSTTTFSNATLTTAFRLTQTTLSTSSGRNAGGVIYFNAFSANAITNMHGTIQQAINSGDGCQVNYVYGSHIANTAMNALRFSLDDISSTFSGRISLYRLVT